MADERTTTFKGDPLVLVGPELKTGDKIPDFELTGNDMSAVSLSQTSGARIFSVVPSLDTPVCDQQTRRFNEEAASIGDVAIYTVSSDLHLHSRAGAERPGSTKSRPSPTTRPANSGNPGEP